MKIEQGKIWDPVRLRWLVLTPEEWVRQHIIDTLTQKLGIDPHRIGREVLVEGGFRADLVIYDRTARPLMIIECKAQSVALTPDVLEQVSRYNIALGVVRYLAVTNGEKFFCFELDDQNRNYRPISASELTNLSNL